LDKVWNNKSLFDLFFFSLLKKEYRGTQYVTKTKSVAQGTLFLV